MFTIVDQSPQLSDHEVSDRMSLCIGFYDSLCDPLISELAKMSSNLNYGIFLILILDLHFVSSRIDSIKLCIDAVSSENSAAKEILYLSIKKAVPAILQSFDTRFPIGKIEIINY
jgi:hypothetical protein